MKSIMEEASSISKAIEQAWNRAGKPSDFSVKVFEESKRNMFGLIKCSAKIALFFDEKSVARQTVQEKKQPLVKKEIPVRHQKPTAAKTPRGGWQPDMVEFMKNWINQTLNIMGLGNIQFSTTTSGNLIKFNFKSSITGKQTSDRLLFSSFAHLVMTALRQKYKRPLPNLKIVLTCD